MFARKNRKRQLLGEFIKWDLHSIEWCISNQPVQGGSNCEEFRPATIFRPTIACFVHLGCPSTCIHCDNPAKDFRRSLHFSAISDESTSCIWGGRRTIYGHLLHIWRCLSPFSRLNLGKNTQAWFARIPQSILYSTDQIRQNCPFPMRIGRKQEFSILCTTGAVRTVGKCLLIAVDMVACHWITDAHINTKPTHPFIRLFT